MSTLKFRCTCGNSNPAKTKCYKGDQGYEATVCTVCGEYADHTGHYEADAWSREFTGLSPTRRAVELTA